MSTPVPSPTPRPDNSPTAQSVYVRCGGSETCALRSLFMGEDRPLRELIMAALDLVVDVFFTIDIILHFYQAGPSASNPP
jgi:hypothetical protein